MPRMVKIREVFLKTSALGTAMCNSDGAWSSPVSHGELGHAQDIVQTLGLPGVKGLKTGTTSTAAGGGFKATTTATASTTITAASTAVKAAATTTTAATATAAHAENVGSNIDERTGTDKGRVRGVELDVSYIRVNDDRNSQSA
jgi:hypothetical protein